MEEDAATVPVGLVVLAKGYQRFQCVRIEDQTLPDGRVITLAVYRTKCKICDGETEATGWARLVNPAHFAKACGRCREAAKS